MPATLGIILVSTHLAAAAGYPRNYSKTLCLQLEAVCIYVSEGNPIGAADMIVLEIMRSRSSFVAAVCRTAGAAHRTRSSLGENSSCTLLHAYSAPSNSAGICF